MSKQSNLDRFFGGKEGLSDDRGITNTPEPSKKKLYISVDCEIKKSSRFSLLITGTSFNRIDTQGDASTNENKDQNVNENGNKK